MQTNLQYDTLIRDNQNFIENIIRKKYCIKDEKNLGDIHDRIENSLTPHFKDHQILISIMEMIRDGRYSPGGSILYGLGNDEVKCSLSNCYYVPIEKDDIESIFEALKRMALVASRRGGTGLDITILRPKNTPVSNAAKHSSGAVSFMPLISETIGTIGQNGRRGAAIITLDIRHPDSLDFIWSKSRTEAVFGKDVLTGKIPDITGANISVKLTDKFMQAVIHDEDWTFIFPDTKSERYEIEWDGNYDKWIEKGYPLKKYETVNARSILKQIAESCWISGDPGVLFFDNMKKWSSGYFDPKLHPEGCNPCLPEWAPVLTPDGYKRIVNLKNKIILDNKNLDCTDVIKTDSDREIYEITLRSGMRLFSSNNHLVSTNRGDISADNINSTDIIKTDYSPIKYSLNKDEWNEGYFSGLLFGDGSISSEPNRVRMSFSLGYKEFDFEGFNSDIINNIIHKFDPTIPNKNYKEHKQTTKCKVLNIDSPIISRQILTKIFKASSKLEFDLFEHSTSFQIGFITGMLSTDGYTSSNDHYKIIGISQSGNRGYEILSQLQHVLASLGVYSRVGTLNNENYDSRGYLNKRSWTLEITDYGELNKHIPEIFSSDKNKDYQYNISTITPLKISRISALKKSQSIKSIRIIDGEYDVYDISVPGENHFVSSTCVVHNCGEQPLQKWGNCLLGAITLHKYVKNPYTSDAEFDNDLFLEDIAKGLTLLDAIIDINVHPLVEQTKTDQYSRRVGQEFTGLADMLAMLGYEYGSEESCEYIDSLFFHKTIEEIKTSIHLAKEKGCAPCFKTKTSREKFIDQPYMQRIFHRMLPNPREILKKEILLNGLRNSAFNTVGPTGSLSIIADNCTSGVEPLYSLEYIRKTRVEGSEEVRVIHYPLLKYIGPDILKSTKDELKKKYKYKEAHELNSLDRIRIQATIQQWTDSSISSTLNMSNSCTIEDIYTVYLDGYKNNLKGMTVYRDGSKEAVLSTVNNDKPKKEELDGTQRAYRYVEFWKGIKVYITVTIDENDKPLEVFANVPYEAGVDENGNYSATFFNERLGYWNSICRLVSLSLRSGLELQEIVRQLEKSCPSMTELPNILRRVLQKFITTTDEEQVKIKTGESKGIYCFTCKTHGVVFRAGCKICINCGYEMCG